MFKNEKFDPEEILKLAGSWGDAQDPLEYINDYNDRMSISQVVRFFEKQGIFFTKTMIQNYVRLGLLPSPLDKRYYTREHFMILAMLVKLKELYPLEVLRDAFAISEKTGKEPDNRQQAQPPEGENEYVSGFYRAFLSIYQEAFHQFNAVLPDILEKVKTETDKMPPVDSDQYRLSLTFLALLAQCAASKQAADSFMKAYIE